MSSQQIREEISAKIAKAMGTECPPWRRPWSDTVVNTGIPCNFSTSKKYKGVNTLLLMMSADRHKFRSMFWGTKRQWESIGAVVDKPAKFDPDWGTDVVFASSFHKERKGAIAGGFDNVFFLKYYTVYNLEQVAALDPRNLLSMSHAKQRASAKKFLGVKASKLSAEMADEISNRIGRRLDVMRPRLNIPGDCMLAREFIEGTGANIVHGGDQAFYHNPPLDYIQLPLPDQFDTIESYYETAFHEMCHWGEADHRVGKAMRHRGDDQYAFSELVAEIGACFLAAENKVPLAGRMLPRSISYIQSWLKQMQGDARYIFEAARQASKVCDHLTQIQEPLTIGV